jgi:mRNA-degrading endonuclease RelE of RelBE toxin-antitoxin system
MAKAKRQGNGVSGRQVLVSNTAVNMISSLHPYNQGKVNDTLATVKSSVLDRAKARKIAGVANAFVARAGDLRVVFKDEGDSVVITSVVAKA